MSKTELRLLLDAMWRDYIALNPQAQLIFELFSQRNPNIINDHIALRTFDRDQVNLAHMAKPFIDAGYTCGGEYHFEAKQLYAQHFEHQDPQFPKVFISQFLTDNLSKANQALIDSLLSQITEKIRTDRRFCYSGRHWSLSYNDYLGLLEESEYAAWLAAFGFRPNHFTIFVNALKSHTSITDVNRFLIEQGIELNAAGGLIKGRPEAYLEQSSTKANKTRVEFSDQSREIPSCYYEFAKRYPLPDGSLYQGFVAASADKIFESTDTN